MSEPGDDLATLDMLLMFVRFGLPVHPRTRDRIGELAGSNPAAADLIREAVRAGKLHLERDAQNRQGRGEAMSGYTGDQVVLRAQWKALEAERDRYRGAIKTWVLAKARCGDYYAENFAGFDLDLAAVVGLNGWGEALRDGEAKP